jgi:hypothetical protein
MLTVFGSTSNMAAMPATPSIFLTMVPALLSS